MNHATWLFETGKTLFIKLICKISLLVSGKHMSAGVKIREIFLSGHKFTHLLKSVSAWDVSMVLAEGKILTFKPGTSPVNGFPTLKREKISKLN